VRSTQIYWSLEYGGWGCGWLEGILRDVLYRAKHTNLLVSRNWEVGVAEGTEKNEFDSLIVSLIANPVTQAEASLLSLSV